MRKTFRRFGYFKLLYLQTYFQIAEIQIKRSRILEHYLQQFFYPQSSPKDRYNLFNRNFYTRDRETKIFLEKVSNGRKKTWQPVTVRRQLIRIKNTIQSPTFGCGCTINKSIFCIKYALTKNFWRIYKQLPNLPWLFHKNISANVSYPLFTKRYRFKNSVKCSV